MDLLDMSRFATSYAYYGKRGIVSYEELLQQLKPAILALQEIGLIKDNASFGVAISIPYWEGDEKLSGTFETAPETHVAFIGGWGEEWQRYAANAVRKMRPLYRNDNACMTTQQVFDYDKGSFDNPVDSVDAGGNYPWGDFPYGGGAWVQGGDVALCVAVSALHMIEDDAIAYLIGMLLGKKILECEGLLA